MILWPLAHHEMMKGLWNAGMLTSKEIADCLNERFDTEYTRHAVIGRAHRSKDCITKQSAVLRKWNMPRPRTVDELQFIVDRNRALIERRRIEAAEALIRRQQITPEKPPVKWFDFKKQCTHCGFLAVPRTERCYRHSEVG